MDPRELSIIVQVVYKAYAEKSLEVDWAKIQRDAGELYKTITFVQEKYALPFHNKTATTPRGGKVVGEPCKDCGTPYVQGNNGAYCKPCYIAWKNQNK